jgi:hypothetical protein
MGSHTHAGTSTVLVHTHTCPWRPPSGARLPLALAARNAAWRPASGHLRSAYDVEAATNTCHALPLPIPAGGCLPCASRLSGRLPGVQACRAAVRGLERVSWVRLGFHRRAQPGLRREQKRMGSIRARGGELCQDRVRAQGLRRMRGRAGRGSRRSETVGDRAVLGSICEFYRRPARGGDVHAKGGASWRRSRAVSPAHPLPALGPRRGLQRGRRSGRGLRPPWRRRAPLWRAFSRPWMRKRASSAHERSGVELKSAIEECHRPNSTRCATQARQDEFNAAMRGHGRGRGRQNAQWVGTRTGARATHGEGGCGHLGVSVAQVKRAAHARTIALDT